jgi:deoxyadenosine/deoxycytidine kinase
MLMNASVTEPVDTVGLWDCDTPAVDGRGMYVAVSGNTAAGKSSLIAALERRLRDEGVDAIGVSERIFHHQYLRRMFSAPTAFAFPIQLSFMLNRHLVLLRQCVELGRTVIMERSHLDDALFLEEHAVSGAVQPDQRRAYFELAEVLHRRLPAPDVLVLMNPPVDLSLARLTAAEGNGERPHEFPSEEAKSAWVERWHGLYTDLHTSFRERVGTDALAETTLVEVDPGAERELAVETVLATIRPKLNRLR